MHLTCPQCGTTIPADQINVQTMVAVCPACHNVFEFSPSSSEKAKRRKVKQPPHLTLHEGRVLQMAFRTNFRLDRSEAFFNSLTGSLLFTMLAFSTVGLYFISNFPIFVPLIFTLGALATYYRLGLLLYNQTHITMNEHQIRVTRQPLPSVVDSSRTIDLKGVVRFACIETPISIKRQYDTPRYTVWAEYEDGTRDMVVHDVIGDYGYFIARQLEEKLYDESPTTAHLVEHLTQENADSVYDLAQDADLPQHLQR